MKILFVISSNGAGKGGHYNSLDHISRAIATVADVKIISIGLTESPLLKENPFYSDSFKFRWYSFLKLNKPFRKLFKTFNPDVVHCFDGGAALMIMTLPAVWNKPVVHTKCGGPNERHMFAQVVGTVILFSEENLDSFKQNMRFKNSELFLIPNRIFKMELLPEGHRIFKKDPDMFTFVRIARIGKSYKKSIEQSIELIKRLAQYSKVKLIIIGTVEDIEILNAINEYVKEYELPVSFITDEHTKKASQMLYLADAVIGTGRGAMEAMALGLPVLLPIKNGNIPVLLSLTTFEDLLKTNFSERGITDSISEIENFDLIKRLVLDCNFYEYISTISKSVAEERFMITNRVIDNYVKIYQEIVKKPKRLYIFKNIVPLFYYINAYRRVIIRETSRKKNI